MVQSSRGDDVMNYERDMRPGSIHIASLKQALTDDWQSRNEPLLDDLRAADIVLGIDHVLDEHVVCYGLELLQSVLNRAPFAEPEALLIKFMLDLNSED